ncbi:Ingression protein fic1 [Paramyrothecium foliicola]|nr:Ingression protein fic1 [Paramyrothecium foliicola]
MAAKQKSHAHNAPHTAGIFADMTVDGPIIGTLVAIVDRAKNLPNRKTIGKQDPYCAARLGKEAKKTTTDIRGGQTPKWDQELRFTVHDSADYYQLKLSIFTDDKKTDLIGETWIDLKGIIVPGGGQSDMWQNLSCKGKYAGEIRLEITYYDNRPKPERVTVKPKQPASTEPDAMTSKHRTPVKRRPLPSDPVTGEAPAAASPVAVPSPDHYQTPPRAHAKQHSHSGFISSQSPLQAMEYNTPSPAGHRQKFDHYSPASQQDPSQPFSTPPRMEGPRQMPRSRDPHETPPQRHHDEREYTLSNQGSPYDQPEPRGQYPPVPSSHYQAPAEYQPVEDDRPPPPPAHRSRHNSTGHEAIHRGGFDPVVQKATPPMPMRYDVLKNEAHRVSMPAYSGRPSLRGYDSAPVAAPSQGMIPYEPSPPRHHSYDNAYEPHHRSMQPTVEDVPESPTAHPINVPRQSAYRQQQEEELIYGKVPSPAPLNLSRSPGTAQYGTTPPAQDPNAYPGQMRYARSVSPSPSYDTRRYSTSPGNAPYSSQSGQSHNAGYRGEAEPARSPSYALPALPPSLIPGVDPNISQEISERIYEERRYEERRHEERRIENRYADQSMEVARRGRHKSEPPPPQEYMPPNYSSGQELVRRPRGASPNPYTNPQQTIRRKSVSPAPPPSDQRRLSDIPFGPDSYDALNPSLLSSHSGISVPDPDAKIITHDGREIDPSDHLPMDTWAPEPEPKQGQKQPSPDPRSRAPLSGAQPMPTGGRRPLRIAARPQATPTHSPSYTHMDDPHTPGSMPSAGRNRLQKKRTSMAPSPNASSPLAPITPDNYQDRQSSYTPTRGVQRSGTWDYPSENHAPHYGSGPPIPAKVPLALMSGANVDDALMEEMSRIDIGTGRSRRRGGY